jgi:integrase/recombinase XerD
MEEHLSAFLEFLQKERNYSENTTAAYRNDLNQFLTFLADCPGLHSWRDVSSELVDRYVEAMRMRGQPYASSSVARKVAALKSFFHFLVARGLVDEDPALELDSPKVKKRLPKTLAFADVERLLASPIQAEKKTPKNLRDAALLALLYATGMRVSEVVSLQIDDLDLEMASLRSPGKDGYNRELPIEEKMEGILQAYLSEGRPLLLKDKTERALFLNHRGQQLTRQGLWLIIKAYAKRSKLSGEVTPHTLRHSFAAHKLASGSNLKEIQQLLGHANISTTQIYAQVSHGLDAKSHDDASNRDREDGNGRANSKDHEDDNGRADSRRPRVIATEENNNSAPS